MCAILGTFIKWHFIFFVQISNELSVLEKEGNQFIKYMHRKIRKNIMDLDIVPCDIHDVFRRRFVRICSIWRICQLNIHLIFRRPFFLFHIQIVQINKINSSRGAENWILYEIFVHFSLRRRANWPFHISMQWMNRMKENKTKGKRSFILSRLCLCKSLVPGKI